VVYGLTLVTSDEALIGPKTCPVLPCRLIDGRTASSSALVQ
jgi:hypothetical protein